MAGKKFDKKALVKKVSKIILDEMEVSELSPGGRIGSYNCKDAFWCNNEYNCTQSVSCSNDYRQVMDPRELGDLSAQIEKMVERDLSKLIDPIIPIVQGMTCGPASATSFSCNDDFSCSGAFKCSNKFTGLKLPER